MLIYSSAYVVMVVVVVLLVNMPCFVFSVSDLITIIISDII